MSEVICFVKCPCKHTSGLCKNWDGKSPPEDISECPGTADGFPYLVIPKITEGFVYEREKCTK